MPATVFQPPTTTPAPLHPNDEPETSNHQHQSSAMNEPRKTGLFALLAVISLAIAWLARPATSDRGVIDDTGQRFFQQFDPLAAKSLEIINWNEATDRAEPFKVAQEGGVWSIPSRENYPADAEQQIAKAAASLVDLVKGKKITDSPADHEQFGVIDPTQAGEGAQGVGMRVSLRDAGGALLADFIIGKSIPETDPGRPLNLRYVRVPGQDRVHQATIQVDALSTRFEDWIEKDLLKLNTTDIQEVVINNYSIDEVKGQIVPGDILQLRFDSKASSWHLDGLTEGEELVEQKLNDLKFALDDLKIVDVHRKPPGLSRELRAQDQMMLDQAAIGSLRGRGFYIHQGQLLSNQGESIVSLSTGVEYMLRFGEIALGSAQENASDAPGSASDSASPSPSEGANRYLFITAQFNPELIAKPDLATVPEVPVEGEAAAAIAEARKKVEDDNQRKQQEYDQKVADGRKAVDQLNARFADWYYVIANSVYEKLRLQRADLVKPKTTSS
jgi:hypothetical protein